MAHVAAWKKDLVKELIDEMTAKPVVAVVNMHGIAGQQIQSMRAGLRQHATLKMTKNNLMRLAEARTRGTEEEHRRTVRDHRYGLEPLQTVQAA